MSILSSLSLILNDSSNLKWLERKKTRLILCLFSYIALFFITYSSLMPLDAITTANIHKSLTRIKFLDKIIHFVSYFLLNFLFILGHAFNRSKKNYYLICFFLWSWSFVIEILQEYSGQRSFEILDLICNGLGIFFAFKISIFKKNMHLLVS